MSVAYYSPVSDSFHKKIYETISFEEKLDVCVDNIDEFLSVILDFCGLRKCQLEKCQIGLLSDEIV